MWIYRVEAVRGVKELLVGWIDALAGPPGTRAALN